MTEDTNARHRTPLGIVLVCLLLGLYAVAWVLTALLAGTTGNGAVASLAVAVGAAVLALAYYLYRGHRVAWWATLALLAASTLWRLTRVANGHPGDGVNAAVGAVIVLYLLSQNEFYGPAGSRSG